MIPRIIHQIWEGKTEPLPEFLSDLSETWRKNHPKWKYEFWDEKRMNDFVYTYYPDFAEKYFSYSYPVQRWDAIRYLILYKLGGMYVDFDYESIEPMDTHLDKKDCCFSCDPPEHADKFNKDFILTNALMAVSANHPFLKLVIENLLTVKSSAKDKINYVLETTGPFFITKLYTQYKDKDKIHLFPTELTSPLTQQEIHLYMQRKINSDYIEEKIEKSIALHYFFGTWYTSDYLNQVTYKPSVLYVSTSDGGGGAANAAYRIHCGLCEIGINSKMLVQRTVKRKPNILVADDVTGNDNEPLKNYKLHVNAHFSPSVTGIDIARYVKEIDPEIVQLHWVNNGFLKIEDLKDVDKKIVWRFADCWPFTGGCHYIENCSGYTDSCGKCPQLSSENEKDLSYEVLLRKKMSWTDLDITVVVPSMWMKEMVKKSAIFKNNRIEIIPNGLDLSKYYAVDKLSARRVLNLPPDKKIILYGAYFALRDRRKGLFLLKEALKQFDENYMLLIFGADEEFVDIDIPVRFLGTLTDELSMRIVYSAADIMIVPSIQEAFGQTVIESMACSTPVIGFENTGVASIIDHEQNGFLASYMSADSLAYYIRRALKNEKDLVLLSERAEKKVKEVFDYRNIAGMYRDLYETI